APVRRGNLSRRAWPCRYIVADRVCRRGHARRGDGARLARPRWQAGADARARSGRGLLPDRLVIAARTMVGGCLGLLFQRCRIAAVELTVAEGRIVQGVAAFILTAVAAHCGDS